MSCETKNRKEIENIEENSNKQCDKQCECNKTTEVSKESLEDLTRKVNEIGKSPSVIVNLIGHLADITVELLAEQRETEQAASLNRSIAVMILTRDELTKEFCPEIYEGLKSNDSDLTMKIIMDILGM